MLYDNKIHKLEQLKQAPDSAKEQIEINSILFNLYNVESVFFNRKAKNIIFHLKDNIKDLYIYDDQEAYKLSNNTKFFSKAFQNFIFVPIETDVNIDAILCKD